MNNRRRWIPAILCNPTLVLHTFNIVISFFRPDELLQPIFATWIEPQLDVHADDETCKIFVLFMVAVQMAIYVPSSSDETEPCLSISLPDQKPHKPTEPCWKLACTEELEDGEVNCRGIIQKR